MALTGKQIRHLRALGHHLEPVLLLGKNGITEAVIAQLSEAIGHHELVKVKLLSECPLDRGEAGEEAANSVGAELVQTLGRTLLLWKRNAQKPKIELPNARGELRPAARKDTSKGKLPPSRKRAPSPEPTEEKKFWRSAKEPSARGPRQAEGAGEERRSASRAPGKRAASPRNPAGQRPRRPPERVRVPPTDQTGRFAGEASRSSGSRSPRKRREQ